jgi:DNA polymerase III psi subunit
VLEPDRILLDQDLLQPDQVDLLHPDRLQLGQTIIVLEDLITLVLVIDHHPAIVPLEAAVVEVAHLEEEIIKSRLKIKIQV